MPDQERKDVFSTHHPLRQLQKRIEENMPALEDSIPEHSFPLSPDRNVSVCGGGGGTGEGEEAAAWAHVCRRCEPVIMAGRGCATKLCCIALLLRLPEKARQGQDSHTARESGVTACWGGWGGGRTRERRARDPFPRPSVTFLMKKGNMDDRPLSPPSDNDVNDVDGDDDRRKPPQGACQCRWEGRAHNQQCERYKHKKRRTRVTQYFLPVTLNNNKGKNRHTPSPIPLFLSST